MHSLPDFPTDNKFKMGEIVYYEQKKYYVVGVQLYLGYDFHLWHYTLAKMSHGDNKPWEYTRCNVDMAEKIKETSLVDAETFNKQEEIRLTKEIEKVKKMLKDLEDLKEKNKNE